MQSVMPRRYHMSLHGTTSALPGLLFFWAVFTFAAVSATHLGLVRQNLGNIMQSIGGWEIGIAIAGGIAIGMLFQRGQRRWAVGASVIVASLMGYFFPLAMGL